VFIYGVVFGFIEDKARILIGLFVQGDFPIISRYQPSVN